MGSDLSVRFDHIVQLADLVEHPAELHHIGDLQGQPHAGDGRFPIGQGIRAEHVDRFVG